MDVRDLGYTFTKYYILLSENNAVMGINITFFIYSKQTTPYEA